MKKPLLTIGIILILAGNIYAAPPTRAYTYVSNTLIDPSQNNANENALYSYLQVGVDTYSAGSITGAAISASASIPYVSLSLTNSIVNADISSVAAIADTKLAQITTASKVSGAALTSLNSVPTGAGALPSKNGGTGSDLSAATVGADPYFSATGIISALAAGTSGQVKVSQGASAPIWANALSSVSDYGTSASASTARQATAIKVAYGHDISVSGGGSTALSNLPFTSSSSYTIICSANTSFGTPPANTDASAGNIVCATSSGSAATIYNTDDQTKTVAWMAIGI